MNISPTNNVTTYQNINFRYIKIDAKTDALIKSVSRIHFFFIRIVDLAYPKEKMLEYLPGVKGMTKENIVCKAEYQLFAYDEVEPYES